MGLELESFESQASAEERLAALRKSEIDEARAKRRGGQRSGGKVGEKRVAWGVGR